MASDVNKAWRHKAKAKAKAKASIFWPQAKAKTKAKAKQPKNSEPISVNCEYIKSNQLTKHDKGYCRMDTEWAISARLRPKLHQGQGQGQGQGLTSLSMARENSTYWEPITIYLLIFLLFYWPKE